MSRFVPIGRFFVWCASAHLCIFVTVAGLLGCSAYSVTDQARVLGSENFSRSKWLAANQIDRGTMVASFLSQHDPKALTTAGVRELLGPPTAYYDYDENSAYLVGPDSVESVYGKGYLLAFVAGRKSGKIVDVKIIPDPRK